MKDANVSPEGAIGLFEEVCGCHRPAGYGVHFYFFSLSLNFFCIHGLLNMWALNVYTLIHRHFYLMTPAAPSTGRGNTIRAAVNALLVLVGVAVVVTDTLFLEGVVLFLVF